MAYPAWTPDGRIVATMYQGEIRTLPNGEDWIQQAQLELFDLRKGTQRTILARRNWTGEPSTPAVSPDGRTVLYTRYNSPLSKPADGHATVRDRPRRLEPPPGRAVGARRRRPPRVRP